MNKSHGTWNDDGLPTRPELLRGDYMNPHRTQGHDAKSSSPASSEEGGRSDSPPPGAKRVQKRTKPQGQPTELSNPEIWPEPVDGQVIANAVHDVVQRFAVLPDHAGAAITLWIFHAHALDSAEFSPILLLTSPDRRCGKSTTLKLLGKLVPRPLVTANASTAAIFRVIEKAKPTLLIDEGESFLENREELRGILNSGHSRDAATVLRAVGEDYEPRLFDTWCPKAIAKIGAIHPTLEDRSISIEMRRKLTHEGCPPVGRRERMELQVLCRKVWTWARENSEALIDAAPVMPRGLHDRAADNWRHLIAIADRIGGEWPGIARESAVALSVSAGESDGSDLARLLADICDLFTRQSVYRVSTHVLLRHLSSNEEGPWAEWRQGKPITATQLASLLRPLRIRPRSCRDGAVTFRGYELDDFRDAFSRYLPEDGSRVSARDFPSSGEDEDDEMPGDCVVASAPHGPTVGGATCVHAGGDVHDECPF